MGSNPTLSATPLRFLPVAIMLRPSAAWTALRRSAPGWHVPLLRHALPLSLVPSIAWPLARFGDEGQGPGERGTVFLLQNFGTTLVLSLVSVLLLAAAFFAGAPMFGVRRSWAGSVTLAAYASTPVFLSSAFLAFPALAWLVVVAFLHCFALCYVGLEQLFDCRDEEAPIFVAFAWVVAGVGSAVLGGLCSAAGFLG